MAKMIKKILLVALLAALVCSLEGMVELTDSNFAEKVTEDSSIWLVFFSADWCGHCKELKPHIERVAPRLGKLGVKVGQVGDKNNKLVNDYVVDHSTHMVSYPKLKVFLGSQILADVPGSIRNQQQLYYWFVNEYNLTEIVDEEL